MNSTSSFNRITSLQNENTPTINPSKNQAIRQQPFKSAFKDVTNAKGSNGSLINNANKKDSGSMSQKTPQIKKINSKLQKEEIQIYFDDYCSSFPKYQDKFVEFAWGKQESERANEKIQQLLDHDFNDCLDYQDFKSDEYLLPAISDEAPYLEIPDMSFEHSLDGICEWVIPEMEPLDIPEIDEPSFFDMQDLEFDSSSLDGSC